MADITQDDWYRRLKSQAASREIVDDDPEESNHFNVKVKRSYVRHKPVSERAVSENIHASPSIMQMHNESMARLRKRFMPPLNRD